MCMSDQTMQGRAAGGVTDPDLAIVAAAHHAGSICRELEIPDRPAMGRARRQELLRRGAPDPDHAGVVTRRDPLAAAVECDGVDVLVVRELAARSTGLRVPE